MGSVIKTGITGQMGVLKMASSFPRPPKQIPIERAGWAGEATEVVGPVEVKESCDKGVVI